MGTITYTIDVEGDQYDHSSFLEVIADFDGATVTEQKEPDTQ